MRAERWAILLAMLAVAACAPTGDGPRRIPAGAACAVCGMKVVDLRYGCEDQRAGTWRFYDSIECLLRADPRAGRAWLADYDARSLHRGDSVWVVQAEIPSPMGGGYAAFLDRAAAEEIAAARRGRVARLADFAGAPASNGRAGP